MTCLSNLLVFLSLCLSAYLLAEGLARVGKKCDDKRNHEFMEREKMWAHEEAIKIEERK